MGKMKTSKVKKSNIKRTKLKKQGKLKYTRNRKTIVKPQQPVIHEEEEEEVESDHGEDFLNMVEADDLVFLKKAVVEGNYSMLKGAQFKKEKSLKRNKDEDADIEEEYEKSIDESTVNKRERLLLPIKSKGSIIKRRVIEEVKDEDEMGPPLKKSNGENEEEEDDDDGLGDELKEDDIKIEKMERDLSKPVSTAEMMAWREQLMAQYKFKIGVLSSGLLEDPQHKIMNIARLLELYDEWHPELQVTLRKLVLVSLLEVLKDIIPSYQIKHQENPDVKLKKETKELQNYEKSLLKGYRGYLQRLEKVASRLYHKKGDTRVWSKADISLGELAIRCLCELVMEHPYFNYSTNIVRVIIPYLDNKLSSVREQVSKAIRHVFINDKRGEITLEIVRRINHLVKTRKHSVKPDVILVLSSLKIQEINLEQIKEAEVKKKKLEEKKSRVINLSKRERKRQKRIAEVEKELLETKAEENKNARNNLLTEVTKVVFMVFFRILKSAPSSGLLSAALQGLAKFAHCINIEFYQDIVTVLNRIMSDSDLKVKEQLNCVLTVFKILSGQGETLTIDPNKFYAHLYRNIYNVDAGVRGANSQLLIDCLEQVILGRRRKLTIARLLAFVKRMSVCSLQNEHHTVLALLNIVKHALQNNKAVDILLDLDTSVGQGLYLSELDDPEYCNAENTALYEMTLLKKHYHPTVRLLAEHIISGVPATGIGSLPSDIAKLSCKEIYKEYDPSQVAFKPAVPIPKTNRNISIIKSTSIRNKELSDLCDKVMKTSYQADFSEMLQKKKKLKKE
ncbi:nucleolar complex protein 3 isoform X2 [Halyomorpha halys]|uniref:nucleolar complex protein 3 isoform X2 n=1 Tax=Halyomorpha halys TaxID=286706 RepID=UPI0034D2286A